VYAYYTISRRRMTQLVSDSQKLQLSDYATWLIPLWPKFPRHCQLQAVVRQVSER